MTTLPCRAGGAPGHPLDPRSGGADTHVRGAGLGLSLPSLYPRFFYSPVPVPRPRALPGCSAAFRCSVVVF